MNEFYDTVTILASLGILLLYQLLIYTIAFNSKTKHNIQLTNNLRNSFNWLIKHEEKTDAGNATLAVHTLRNIILVSAFIGGQAFVFASESLISLALSYHEDDDDIIFNRRLQSAIISSLLFISFVNWANVALYSSNLGYLIGTFDIFKRHQKIKPVISTNDDDDATFTSKDDLLTEGTQLIACN